MARISQTSSAAVSRNPVHRWDSWADSEPSEVAEAHQCTDGLTPGLLLVLRLLRQMLLLPHGAWTQVSKDYAPPHLQQLNNGCQSFGWRDRPEARELGSTGSYGRLCTIYSCQAVRLCMCVLRFTTPEGPSAVQSWPNAEACPTSKLLPETSAKVGAHPTVKPCLLPPSPQ